MKLSRCDDFGLRRPRDIPFNFYKKYNETYLGGEEFDEVLLCSMEDTDHDFYDVLASINFKDNILQRFDDIIESQNVTESMD